MGKALRKIKREKKKQALKNLSNGNDNPRKRLLDWCFGLTKMGYKGKWISSKDMMVMIKPDDHNTEFKDQYGKYESVLEINISKGEKIVEEVVNNVFG